MKRHPYVWAILLCVVSLAAGAGGAVAFLTARQRTVPSPDHVPPPRAPVVTVLGQADAARLPADRVLLPAAGSAECRGVLVCGHCKWGVGDLCHQSVLWDEAKKHIVYLLPNEKLRELQEKLTPK